MQIKEIYSKIIEHQIEGIMLHEQASKMLDEAMEDMIF